MIRALLALALWLLTSPALAAVQNCTFAWNARTDADLAGYKVPRTIVFVDEVKRTPAGKADYKWAKAAADQPAPA